MKTIDDLEVEAEKLGIHSISVSRKSRGWSACATGERGGICIGNHESMRGALMGALKAYRYSEVSQLRASSDNKGES